MWLFQAQSVQLSEMSHKECDEGTFCGGGVAVVEQKVKSGLFLSHRCKLSVLQDTE